MYEPYYTCCYTSYPSTSEDPYEISSSSSISTPTESKKKPVRRSKHIPHHLRPQHIVERRNTRERRRVQDVNQAFLVLKALLPFDSTPEQCNSSRISKVRTLRKAVDYIKALQNLLNE